MHEWGCCSRMSMQANKMMRQSEQQGTLSSQPVMLQAQAVTQNDRAVLPKSGSSLFDKQTSKDRLSKHSGE